MSFQPSHKPQTVVPYAPTSFPTRLPMAPPTKKDTVVNYFIVRGHDDREGLNGYGINDIENSTFTYNDGIVTRIDYESGQSKVFTYNLDNTVSQIVWDRITDTVTKTFTYNLDGTLASVNINIT